jgi:hypothetical protein
MTKLVVAFPFLGGWLSGPVGWALGWAAYIFIKYADLLTYIFIDDWETSHEATNYENASETAAQDPTNAQARADQENAFNNLFG